MISNLPSKTSVFLLTLTMLWANSADDKLLIFFPEKIGFNTACKLAPDVSDMLFSG